MNNTTNNTNSNQSPQAPAPATGAKESEEEPCSPGPSTSANNSLEKADEAVAGEEDVVMAEKDSAVACVNSTDDPIEEDAVNPATVFCIKLKQPKSNLLHKMSVPELCRTFRCVFEV